MRPRSHVPIPLVAALLVLLVGACDTGLPTPPPPAIAPSPSIPASPTGTFEPSSSDEPSDVPAPVGGGDRPDLGSVRVALEPITGGLDSPLFMAPVGDGSGRLFVVEQGGVIRILEDGALREQPFLDISDRVSAGGERGLLGLAVPPAFGTGRDEFFVHYSDLEGDTVIAAFRATGDDLSTADPGSERTILTEDQPYANHNGGWIGFDADGMLLIALGDGGGGGDPENRASNLRTILGKLLRIDVLGATGEPYAIPEDNPFVGQADARPEILHFGLRNPFRDSVDQETGAIWIGDVGQGAWEEIDVAQADARGLDFGWRRWEGSHCYDESAGCDEAGVTMPVTEYPHGDDGCSVTGGVVYRGDAIPALRGAYLFADYCSGRLWAIDAGFDGPQPPILLSETGRSISSIGLDEDGEVVITDLAAGELVRLVPGG
jgi:glucose/arabinose dehydrogenase